jgi:hypothetical protein
VPERGLIPTILRKKSSDEEETRQSASCHQDRDAQTNTHQIAEEDANNTNDIH